MDAMENGHRTIVTIVDIPIGHGDVPYVKLPEANHMELCYRSDYVYPSISPSKIIKKSSKNTWQFQRL